MTYENALKFIHGVNWTFCKPGLERIKELCQRLGNPQKNLRFIHVGGTNGKGSFCSMLSSVLRKAGYKCGLYTSPYVIKFNERIQIDGAPISDGELVRLCERMKPIVEEMKDKPTEFELITAIAFEHFKNEGVDVVVLEVGMGGRLDATNIIDSPLLSVITGIALDHTAFLGDTVEKIALEKAGIIKDAPTLYGGEDDIANAVISEVAKSRGVGYSRTDYTKLEIEESSLLGTAFRYKKRDGLKISLLGLYQPRNAAVVLDAVDILNDAGLKIDETSVREGLLSAVWKARFEIICKDPLFIFDGAHNPQGIAASVESIKHYFKDKVHVITGVLRDKDYNFIASKLSEVAEAATTVTPDNDRALPAGEYAALLRSYGLRATEAKSMSDALKIAMRDAKNAARPLLCLGSLYTYSEVYEALND